MTGKDKCCITLCSESVFAHGRLGSSEQMQGALEIAGLQVSTDTIPVPTPLCKHHYHLVYNLLTQTNCITCGISLRSATPSPRYCPKPELIEKHLKDNTGFEGNIGAQDKVCFTCYKAHLAILQENKSISTDSELRQLVRTFSQQIPTTDVIVSVEDVLNAAIIKTTVLVGEELLSNHATLLPSVQDSFSRYVHEFLMATNLESEGGEVNPLVPSRWILSNLTANLKHHMSYTCRARKYGTLLYRTNSDLLSPLTQALWRLRNLSKPHTVQQDQSDSASFTQHVTSKAKVFDELNEQIHSQIKRQLEKDAESPFEYHDLDIDKFLGDTNPCVWEAVCLLTRSVSERRGTSKVNDPTSLAYHTKKLRRFFLLCAICFCTDERCSMPLHTLLADVAESQGGSQLLIKILNCFGICASSDTLSRFIQYKVNSLEKATFLNPEGFTVVSADNIDFQLSFARVFCGKHTSSWHGTSIQAAQPLPSLSQCQNDVIIPSSQASVPLSLTDRPHSSTLPSVPLSLTDRPHSSTLPSVPLSLTDRPHSSTLPSVPLSLTDRPHSSTLPSVPLSLTDRPHSSTLPSVPLSLTDRPHSSTLPSVPLSLTDRPHSSTLPSVPLSLTDRPHSSTLPSVPLSLTDRPHSSVPFANSFSSFCMVFLSWK